MIMQFKIYCKQSNNLVLKTKEYLKNQQNLPSVTQKCQQLITNF